MKKLVSVFLAVAILLSCFAASAVTLAAEEQIIADGVLSESSSWSLSTDGVLSISGNGDMPDFSAYSDQPWRALAASVKSVVISDGITRVGAHSFELLPALSSVSLPKSLTSIGESALERCYAVKLVDVPSSVRTIERRAFADCWQLATYDIAYASSYLTYIGDEAFAGCTSLTTTNIPQRLLHLGDGAYLGCASLNNIKLPDRLEYLGRSAFQSCTSLREINIPWQITSVPDFAFFGCTSLESVTFGRHLEKIGREVFLWCPALKTLNIPKGVTEMPDFTYGFYYFNGEYRKYDGLSLSTASEVAADYARRHGLELILDDDAHVCADACPYCALCTSDCEFLNCAEKCPGHIFPITGTVCDGIAWSLSEDFVLTLTGSGEMPDFTYDAVPWIKYRSGVKTAVISDGIVNIGAYAFDSHENLREVSLPDSVTRVGRKAFALCTSLESATLPDSISEIAPLAFFSTVSLKSIIFPKGLKNIGSYAFAALSSLESVRLFDGVETIGEGAFEGCAALTEFHVPASVTHIGSRALGYRYSEDRHFVLVDSFKISAPMFGAGHSYAEKNGIEYVRSDTHVCEHICVSCGRCLDADCKYPECAKKCDGICTADWSSPFSDVKTKHWYYDHVRYVCLAGIMNGMTKTSFEPNGGITRAQLVLMLWRLAGEPAPGTSAPADDVTASWYRDAVAWGYESGVVTGRSATKFDPNGEVTREELVTMLMRYASYTGVLSTDARAELDSFNDTSRVHAYAKEAMSWAVAEGFVKGEKSSSGDGRLSLVPRDGASRAECAAVFERFLKKL